MVAEAMLGHGLVVLPAAPPRGACGTRIVTTKVVLRVAPLLGPVTAATVIATAATATVATAEAMAAMGPTTTTVVARTHMVLPPQLLEPLRGTNRSVARPDSVVDILVTALTVLRVPPLEWPGLLLSCLRLRRRLLVARPRVSPADSTR